MVFIDFDLHIPQTHVIWRALWVSKVGLDFKDVKGSKLKPCHLVGAMFHQTAHDAAAKAMAGLGTSLGLDNTVSLAKKGSFLGKPTTRSVKQQEYGTLQNIGIVQQMALSFSNFEIL